jgi:hypothetical protein
MTDHRSPSLFILWSARAIACKGLSINTPERILHDRVNLVRFVRRLDKSIGESDWNSGRRTTLWLEPQRPPLFPTSYAGMTSSRLLSRLKHARRLLNSVELYNETQPSAMFLLVLETTLA